MILTQNIQLPLAKSEKAPKGLTSTNVAERLSKQGRLNMTIINFFSESQTWASFCHSRRQYERPKRRHAFCYLMGLSPSAGKSPVERLPRPQYLQKRRMCLDRRAPGQGIWDYCSHCNRLNGHKISHRTSKHGFWMPEIARVQNGSTRAADREGQVPVNGWLRQGSVSLAVRDWPGEGRPCRERHARTDIPWFPA